jgi:uncharacterized protein YceK
MRSWRVWAVVIPCLSGCGTVSNLAGPDAKARVYGGVRQDCAAFYGMEVNAAALRSPNCDTFDGNKNNDIVLRSPFAVFAALDLPLSVVGDTLTLPYTLFVNSDLFKHEFIYKPTDEFRALMASPPPGER